MPKHGMNHKTIILTAVLFGLIVSGMFIYAKLRSNELHTSTEAYILALLERVVSTTL
jgi:hypothetical protein